MQESQRCLDDGTGTGIIIENVKTVLPVRMIHKT